MVKAKTGLRMALAGLALLALGACAEVIRNHGYTPSDEDLSAVTVGKDTRETVTAKVGRPSAGGLMADSGWYYVQSRWSHKGARAPQEIDRQVLAISFDARGQVSNIERFGLQDGQVVALSRRVTDTNIKGVGFIQQMMGNFGRFNPGQFIRQGL
ncbi:MAG: outer membrane protein assembly factor BamE [Rhodobacterales bacterium]|mgnify:CR=1 FL=1|nr:outer membrane protein assembly factor BamE [Rhodobacterales bacterium]MDX5500004.1 outer membrane protein assembly factor BamE [Rhodobacterales bacterium]